MTALRVPMRLLIDINVPEDVAALFRGRKHTILMVRSYLDSTADDEEIARLADEEAAIVLTWDKDFGRIISRASIGTRRLYRHAGRISFVSIPYRLGLRRAETVIDLIEFEHAHLRARHDSRLIVTVRRHQIVLER